MRWEIAIFLVHLEYNGAGDWSGGYAHCYPPWTGTVGGLFNGAPVNSLILTPSTHLWTPFLTLRIIR